MRYRRSSRVKPEAIASNAYLTSSGSIPLKLLLSPINFENAARVERSAVSQSLPASATSKASCEYPATSSTRANLSAVIVQSAAVAARGEGLFRGVVIVLENITRKYGRFGA